MYKYIGKANKNNMQTSNINQQVRLGNPERYIWYKYLEFLKERKENEQDMIFCIFQCLIDYFEEDKDKLVTHLCPDLVNNQLIVTDKSESISPVKIKVKHDIIDIFCNAYKGE